MIAISETKYTIYHDGWMWTLSRPSGGAIGCGSWERCVARMGREIRVGRRARHRGRAVAVAKRWRVKAAAR